MADDVRQFSVYISVDEWRNIAQWMYASLVRSEREATGHFLLVMDGPRRTWVTSDGAQLTVLEVDGPAPICNFDRAGPLDVLVNSRFFRSKDPEDVTLTVTEYEDGRIQTLRGDGFEMSLPEHPGPYPDWSAALGRLDGIRVEVDSQLLWDACNTADLVPWGVEDDGEVSAWIYIRDGRLVVDAPWYNFPNTTVEVDIAGDLRDTVPVLVSPRRLGALLIAIAPARVTLTLPDKALGLVGLEYDNYRALLMPLDRWGEQRHKLEELLMEYLRSESIEPDADGDYGIVTPEGNQLWVRLHTDVRPISAQVFSVLADDVDCSEDLLREINSINASAAYVKVMWAEGAIMTEVDIVAESLDITELSNALTVVQETADRYRGILSAYFGSVEE